MGYDHCIKKVRAKVDTANRKVSIPSQDAGVRGLKLNYQASDLKPKEVAFFTQ